MNLYILYLYILFLIETFMVQFSLHKYNQILGTFKKR